MFKGIAGLFLYIGALFVPVGESRLDVKALISDNEYHHIRTTFEFRWDDNLTDFVDAGISVGVKYTVRYDRQKHIRHRIIRKPVSQKEYLVVDSLPDGTVVSESFANIPLALRRFRQIEWEIETGAKSLEFSVDIENSFVPSMGIYVDITPAFGGRKFTNKIRME